MTAERQGMPLTSEMVEEAVALAKWVLTHPHLDLTAEAGVKLSNALLALRALEDKDRVLVPREEYERLCEVEHRAWHLLDDSEERVTEQEIVFFLPNEDHMKLCELLSEEHPRAMLDAAISADRHEGKPDEQKGVDK